MRASALVPVLLLLAGAGLVAAAVASGRAQVSLFVVVPVVSGGSLEFLGGVLLVIAGIFLLPLTFRGDDEEPRAARGRSRAGSPGEPPGGGYGGVVLVGPIPIFLGRWRSPPRWAFWLAVAVGVALTIVLAFEAFAVLG